MFAVGKIEANNYVSLSIDGVWISKVVKNPEEIPLNHHGIGLFRYHINSDECYWVNPNVILECAKVET